MRTIVLISAAAIMAAATAPAFAANMMGKGDTMMMMSDGSMSTMHPMAGHTMSMKGFHRMTGCVVTMMGKDGKVYMMQATDKQCASMGKM